MLNYARHLVYFCQDVKESLIFDLALQIGFKHENDIYNFQYFLNSLHTQMMLFSNARHLESNSLMLSCTSHLVYLCQDVQESLIFDLALQLGFKYNNAIFEYQYFLNSLHAQMMLLSNAQHLDSSYLMLSCARQLVYLCKDVKESLIFDLALQLCFECENDIFKYQYFLNSLHAQMMMLSNAPHIESNSLMLSCT